MVFSYSSELISLSKFYKFNVVTIIILAIVGIILNIILIPIYGLIGAALASMISIIIFNIIKYFYIKIKIGISPFSIKTIKILAVGIIIFIGDIYFSIDFKNDFINILIKSSLIVFLFSLLIYKMNISQKLNKAIGQYLKS